MAPIVPPIKCQGIKTKLIPMIRLATSMPISGTWIEPFCGSCVVALNVQPQRAILSDTNHHIIKLYQDIQRGSITPGLVKEYLQHEGETLLHKGVEHYLQIRKKFNEQGGSLEFLFLNRSCFNGVMRFNKKGKFNVPFCRKPERFRQAYITKIANQVSIFQKVVQNRDWVFIAGDFRSALSHVNPEDFVYADPPYMGRHVDYFNGWGECDDIDLIGRLKELPCRFLLSTWHSNKYRTNPAIAQYLEGGNLFMETVEHFYHVGPSEELRNSMKEALISNAAFASSMHTKKIDQQLALL